MAPTFAPFVLLGPKSFEKCPGASCPGVKRMSTLCLANWSQCMQRTSFLGDDVTGKPLLCSKKVQSPLVLFFKSNQGALETMYVIKKVRITSFSAWAAGKCYSCLLSRIVTTFAWFSTGLQFTFYWSLTLSHQMQCFFLRSWHCYCNYRLAFFSVVQLGLYNSFMLFYL